MISVFESSVLNIHKMLIFPHFRKRIQIATSKCTQVLIFDCTIIFTGASNFK